MNIDRNVLTLAYLGDSVYEIYVRNYLVQKGIVKVNDLQREAVTYVSAKGQAVRLKKMMDANVLEPIEYDLVMRARNHKSTHKPKYTDIITYKYATGLEALIGYLYLEKKEERIQQLMDFILGE